MSTEGQDNHLIDVQRATDKFFLMFLVCFQPAIMSNIKCDSIIGLVLYLL